MFLNDLTVSEIGPGRWRLKYDLVWLDAVSEHTVPAGFVTDFATVPRPLWCILPPFGKYTKAAVLHDYLYSICAGRRKADETFMRAMKVDGAHWWQRWSIYLAVRAFGWAFYASRVPKER
jgi:hypothetical protein